MKLSIIVPVYNVEKYISKCLDSILEQSFKDFEIIIVDDGSTDNSMTTCEKYASEDKRIKIVHISNHGSAYARNIGLKVAQGEYIGFVDSDDWVEANMYEELICSAEEENADIVSCDMKLLYDDGNTRTVTCPFRGGKYSEDSIVSEVYPKLICSQRLEQEIPVTMVLKVFKRAFIERNNIRFVESFRVGQDFVFSATAFYYKPTFVYKKGCYFYYYVQHGDSRTHRYIENAIEIFNGIYDYFTALVMKSTEYDFSSQLKLGRFSGVLSSLKYMVKPGSHGERAELKKILVGIMKTQIDRSVYRSIDWYHLSKEKMVFCALLRLRLYSLCATTLILYSRRMKG